MLPIKRRGGAVARQASLLALLAIPAGFTTGCRKATPSLPVVRQYVRLEALLPLHPAWPQVQALDAAQARFRAAQVQASTLRYPQVPLPPVFDPPITIPPSLAGERDRRMQEDALHYVQQTEEALTATNQDLMKRFERREQRQTAALYSRALAERELKISAADEQEAAQLEARGSTLGFRQVALRTQIEAYTNRLNQDVRNPVVQDAVRQEALVSEQMNALADQRKAVLARDVRALAVQQLAPQNRQWQEESAARLQARKAELADSMRAQVEQARARLQNAIKPIPPLAATLPPASEARATPLPLPLAPDAGAAIGRAQSQLGGAMLQEQQAWQAQKTALLTSIRADTGQAVAQIARREGWNLVPPGRGAQDVTTQAAGAVRTQWRQNAVAGR
jgi:hypothetical protein